MILGTAYGATSPVGVLSPTLYVHALFEADARLLVDDTHAERAFYVVEGEIACDGTTYPAGTLVVVKPGAQGHARSQGTGPRHAARRRPSRG